MDNFQAYGEFARVYDMFQDNVDYQTWGKWLKQQLAAQGITDGLVLDLGCGTGTMTEILAEAGYDMIGVDNSGEMLAEARQQSGAQKLSGHDIMALERFDPATRHMIVFDVLTHDSPVGWKGEKMRLFLTDTGYSKALENQEKGHIKIRNHAKVLSGNLHYDHKDRER